MTVHPKDHISRPSSCVSPRWARMEARASSRHSKPLACSHSPNRPIWSRRSSLSYAGALYALAFMGLARAFGPVLAEGLTTGAGIRATAGALGEAAVAQTGRSALINAALITSMDVVEQNRPALAKTPEGRAFLAVFDVAMTIWIAHDVARILESLPRLLAATDRVIASMSALRESLLAFRDELEAFRRAAAKWAGLGADVRVLSGAPGG